MVGTSLRSSAHPTGPALGAVTASNLDALVPQEPALSFQPAAVFHQRAAGADQAVAGQDDADRVGAVGVADGAHRAWRVETGRERAVAQRGACGNVRQRLPDLLLERRAGDTPFD